MALPIEDYGFIGDMQTAALVGRDGSIDWLCLPRFDSGACFAALLGERENGRWLIAPDGDIRRTARSYGDCSMILETTFETETGVATIVDFLAVTDRMDCVDLVRLVRGERGRVTMRTELIIRFDYGQIVPWVRRQDGGLRAIAGPDALDLHTAVALHGHDFTTIGAFEIAAGEIVPFTLTWYPSHLPPPPPIDPSEALESTQAWWLAWSRRCTAAGPWCEAVQRSQITLKALTYAPTGGIVAAATTSLPEEIRGTRNWDYRYCWIRDASFTLYALLLSGFREEAKAWHEWLLRSCAGRPAEMQIMYGVAGERRLTELELPWLKGYEGSRPVRIGNGAHGQVQLDVCGQIMDVGHTSRKFGIGTDVDSWLLQRTLMAFLETCWDRPDEGIWEIRGPRRHFTISKVMVWVAFDRAVKAVKRFGLDGPIERWRQLRDTIHDDVCRKGFNPERNAFVQYYGSTALDASLLLMAPFGFLPATDPRIVGTVEAIMRDLSIDGLVRRYQPEREVEGVSGGEGAFIACSFWLVDNLAMMGRYDEARALFERLLSLRNDLGLLAEEYDPHARRQLGNFPQAYSHVALINAAQNLVRFAPEVRRAAAEPAVIA